MIAVLEDDAEQREALATLLGGDGFVVRAFATTDAMLAAAAEPPFARVLLADLQLGDASAFDALQRVSKLSPTTSVVALTGHAGDDWLFPAIEAGCVGYVLKSDAFKRLTAVVREVLDGGSPMTAEISRRVLRRLRPQESTDLLSDRELEVLRWLADGYTYEQVAMHCGLSIDSVRTYVRRTYAKLGVNTKSEATQRAMRLGLLT